MVREDLIGFNQSGARNEKVRSGPQALGAARDAEAVADCFGMNVADELAHKEFGEQFGSPAHRYAFVTPDPEYMLQRRARTCCGALEEAASELAVAHAARDHDTYQCDRFGIQEVRVEGACDPVENSRAVAARLHCLTHDFVARGGVFEHRRFEQAVLVAEQFIDRRQRTAGTLHDVAQRRILVPALDEQSARRLDDRAATKLLRFPPGPLDWPGPGGESVPISDIRLPLERVLSAFAGGLTAGETDGRWGWRLPLRVADLLTSVERHR